MTLEPMPAARALEIYFLEARCKLLELAAILDRIDRGSGMANDERMARIQNALKILGERGIERGELVQTIFSLQYDPNWKRPTPR